MIKEEHIDVNLHNKIPLISVPVEKIVTKMYEWTSNIHTDIPKSTLDVMNSDIPKLYVGLHKSLWETMGVPVVIHKQGLEIPYIVIGKNLVKGIFKPFMKANGCIYVERAAKDQKQQDYYSALEIKKKITIGLDRGDSVLIFPTDGRTKDGQTNSFFSTPFDAALSHLKNGPVYIIPIDVDYERLNDMPRMLKSISKGKSYTFKIWHFPDWWKDLGNIYVNFGEPIEINEKTNRKKINRYTLEKAKDRVKILSPNAYSAAVLELKEKGLSYRHLPSTIDDIIDRLDNHQDKFVGFKNSDDVIYNAESNSKITFDSPIRAHMIYAGYIAHYFNK